MEHFVDFEIAGIMTLCFLLIKIEKGIKHGVFLES